MDDDNLDVEVDSSKIARKLKKGKNSYRNYLKNAVKTTETKVQATNDEKRSMSWQLLIKRTVW